jgi:hypothetical protein
MLMCLILGLWAGTFARCRKRMSPPRPISGTPREMLKILARRNPREGDLEISSAFLTSTKRPGLRSSSHPGLSLRLPPS